MQLYISLSIVFVLTLCVNWFLFNLSSKGGSSLTSDVLYHATLNMFLNMTMATKILEQKVSTLETDNAFYKQQIRLLQQKREEEQKLDENVKNVAIMAEGGGYAYYSLDSIFKFPDVIFNVGVKGLNNFISSGIFEAEVAGIYIVAVTVNSGTVFGQCELSINKNSETIAYVARTRYGNQIHTGIVITQLAIGDKISIKVFELKYSNGLYAYGTFLTIVNIQ